MTPAATAVTEPSAPADRFERGDKFAARRAELADAALLTLGELGYARTSLREIAQATSFSHGVLHYYFRDKDELISFCVRRYKAVCVTRYDDVVAHADDVVTAFADALVDSLRDDLAMHRLWYDLRSQSTFEERLRSTVRELDASLEAMVWRVVLAHADRTGGTPAVPSTRAYATFDGLFENALVRHVSRDERAADDLRDGARWLLPLLVTP